MRKKHNGDLIKRMNDGDSLKSFDSMSSWFPPRPVIKKDVKVMAKLYKEKEEEASYKPSDIDVETEIESEDRS